MSQQINLFNPIFLKQKKHFSAATMMQALGLILLGAIGLSAYASYQLDATSKEAAETNRQFLSVQSKLAEISAAGVTKKSRTLEIEIERTEAEIKAMQQVFGILRQGDFGNTKGYAEYLRAFARQIVPDLWLTGISIVGAGREVGMNGRSLRPELVPVFINRLRSEPAMQGKSFSMLEMHRPLAEPSKKPDAKPDASGKSRAQVGYIEFSLQSGEVGTEKVDSRGEKRK